MNKNVLFSLPLLASAILAAGCHSDDPAPTGTGKPVAMVFDAGRTNIDMRELGDEIWGIHTRATAHTRTVMDKKGIITWETTDAICVNGVPSAANANPAGAFAKFPITIPQAANYDAIYPASLVSSLTDYHSGNGTYTITFPDSQPWKDNVSFASDVNPSVAHSDDSNLTFYNACGIIKLTMTKAECYGANMSDVRYARFVSTGKHVAGVAQVTTRTKTPRLSIINGSSTQMDVVFPNTGISNGQIINDQPVTFYMVLPVGTYEKGWKIQLIEAGTNRGLSEITSSKDLTIERSGITVLGSVAMIPAGLRICLDSNGTTDTSDDKLMFTNDPANLGLYFKYGSVVGLAGGSDNATFDRANVVFNPSSTYAPSDTWGDVPYSSGTDVAHTFDNVKAGKGDPCRLVGYTLGEIQTILGESRIPDNGKYRLPIHAENAAFCSTYGNFANDGMTFTSAGVFLPAAGYWENNVFSGRGNSGGYWSGTALDSSNGYSISFSGGKVGTVGSDVGSSGFSVRCVSQR